MSAIGPTSFFEMSNASETTELSRLASRTLKRIVTTMMAATIPVARLTRRATRRTAPRPAPAAPTSTPAPFRRALQPARVGAAAAGALPAAGGASPFGWASGRRSSAGLPSLLRPCAFVRSFATAIRFPPPSRRNRSAAGLVRVSLGAGLDLEAGEHLRGGPLAGAHGAIHV